MNYWHLWESNNQKTKYDGDEWWKFNEFAATPWTVSILWMLPNSSIYNLSRKLMDCVYIFNFLPDRIYALFFANVRIQTNIWIKRVEGYFSVFKMYQWWQIDTTIVHGRLRLKIWWLMTCVWQCVVIVRCDFDLYEHELKAKLKTRPIILRGECLWFDMIEIYFCTFNSS